MVYSKIAYKEKINVNNAKYLLGMSNDNLKDLIKRNPDDWNGEDLFSNLDTYISQLKKWLNKAIIQMEKNGYVETEYKYSKTLVNIGRIYVVGFGIQKLTRELRGFLINGLCKDYDIINCHPSILVYLINKYFNDKKGLFKTIFDYVENRDKYINDYKLDKVEIIKLMNDNKIYRGNNQYYYKLDKELKIIQKLIFNELEKKLELDNILLSQKALLKQNKEGKFLNKVLTVYENNILQLVINNYNDKIHTPMYDGLTMEGDISVKELNKITKEYNLKWSIKEHDTTSIIYDESKLNEITIIPDYESQKKIFEKEHFIIENPLMYGRFYEIEGERKYQLYNKEKFKELVAPIKYFETDEKPFFNKWIEDPKRKSYKEIKFVPIEKESKTYFNSFKGFKKFNGDYEEDDRLIDNFKELIGNLVNYEEKSIDYVIKYIAHIIQKPNVRPETSMLFKSKQGYGKDTLIDTISNLIGNIYLCRTADPSDIFGNYNSGIKEKLILQLNELEGKDGFTNKEKLKNYITEKETIIREKYVSQYTQNNYIRVIICSNNLNPIEISHDDRRFIVFKAHHKKKDSDFFKEYRKLLDNENCLYNLMEYLKNINIKNFNPRENRPITEAYKNMKEHNINPLYKFLYTSFIKDNYNEFFNEGEIKKQRSKPNLRFVKSENLISSYKLFLSTIELNHIDINFKTIKSILTDINIKKEQVKIGSQNNKYYIIDVEDLEEQLEHLNLEEEVIEIDEDDFY